MDWYKRLQQALEELRHLNSSAFSLNPGDKASLGVAIASLEVIQSRRPQESP